eukprot:CAMPEP_0171804026 /NCGR_PEP_ID=MMETSP0991-20121206/73834_1 /TAXON_ID=483369 /ORGANISM="non described non described, Strain CCMP2098" /LENGTH=756 /DNA_ID=CAMNT_0012416257 /DNA_START=344 /DNA_END=2609 /DNA_ORIENTATION=-
MLVLSLWGLFAAAQGVSAGVAVDETSTFITSHRVSMVSPSPANTLAEGVAFNATFQMSFERWPVSVLRSTGTVFNHDGAQQGCASVAFEIVLDGISVRLELPCGEAAVGLEGPVDLWRERVSSFCDLKGLSGDNCGWLWARVRDLRRQLHSQLLGASDDFSTATACLTLWWEEDAEAKRERVACAPAAADLSITVPGLLPGSHALAFSLHRNSFGGGGGEEAEGAAALPGLREVEVLPRLVVNNAAAADSGASTRCSFPPPKISHPRHGALVGPTAALQITGKQKGGDDDVDDEEDDANPSLLPSVLCLSLNGAELGCHAWPPLDAPFLRGLTPGRHALQAWWGLGDGLGAQGVNQRACAKSKVEFEVTDKGPAAKREVAWAIGEEEEGRAGEVERFFFFFFFFSSSSSSSSASLLQPLAAGLLLVTGASERYFQQRILHNLVGSVHVWEPFAVLEVWDFGLSEESKVEIRTWRNVVLKYLPRPTLRPLNPLLAANATSPSSSSLSSLLQKSTVAVAKAVTEASASAAVPAHFHVPGVGAYAAKPWVAKHALRQRSLSPSAGDSCPDDDKKASAGVGGGGGSGEAALTPSRSVLWVDANCELRRPLLGSTLPDRLLGRGAFFVTHPYGFPSTQFHHPHAVSRLGCTTAKGKATAPGDADDADDEEKERAAAGNKEEGFVVAEGSLPHCATTFMGFTLLTKQGRSAAKRVLGPLVSCAERERCVSPLGSSRANHRQEQTALNAILCANSLADHLRAS